MQQNTVIEEKFELRGRSQLGKAITALEADGYKAENILTQVSGNTFSSNTDVRKLSPTYEYIVYQGDGGHVLLCHLTEHIKPNPTHTLAVLDDSQEGFAQQFPVEVLLTPKKEAVRAYD